MVFNYKNTPVHYEVHGEGNPVILIHGFLEDSKIWDAFIPSLKTHCQVIALDLFGHGETPNPDGPYTMENLADAVSALMDHCHIASASLIGHSMGGYVTMAFVERFCEKADRILLLNSTSAPDSDKRKKERDQSIKIVRKNKRAFVRMAITHLFAEENRVKFKTILEHHIREAMKMPTGNITAALEGMKMRHDRTEVLERFPRKKWIVSGDKDPLIPQESILEISDKTGAKLIKLPCGHLSYIELDEEVGKIIRNFLA